MPPRPAPHLIVFSHLRWDFVYQRPQHLLSRLARERPVLFVEEPMPGPATARLERFTPCDGVEVLRPYTPAAASGFHDDHLPHLEPLLADYLRDFGIDRYDAWLYTPMALPLLRDLAPRLVIYDCMDELASFKDAPRQMLQREHALLKRADLVLCGGPSLYDSKRTQHDHVLCLPSAVDAEHYRPRPAPPADAAGRAEGAINGINEGIGTPRLGFFGVIDERLDTDLIAHLADADPRWQVVMVGPIVKIDPDALPARPNIHWIGQQSYQRLPHWVAGWDVCLVPFARNAATRFISPTKTLEYMAAEKPVVSTAINDVERLYRHAVTIAADADEFIAACRAALEETPTARARRIGRMRETVAQLSWQRAAERVSEAIAVAARREQRRRATPPADLVARVPALRQPPSTTPETRVAVSEPGSATAAGGERS